MELPIIELSGSPRRMGEDFGEICREEILQLYQLRLDALMASCAERADPRTVQDILRVAGSCLDATRSYDPVGYEEFTGIVGAAGLTPEQGYVLQGLTDLRDLVAFSGAPDDEACSSFIVGAERTAEGALLLGQNWDLRTDNMPYVRLVHRTPAEGPETWSLTLTGCLTLIGINSEGIAVGNTNLRTTDVRPGTQYLTVLHRALRARSLEEAVDSIRRAPRAAAHYYYVAGPHGAAVGLECSAAQCVPFAVDRGILVHCNHALSPTIAALEAQPPGPSSLHRQARLTHLLEKQGHGISVEYVRRSLSDHEGGEDRCLCRHDWDQVSTNACVIMSPATREIHACRAQPHVGKWETRRIAP